MTAPTDDTGGEGTDTDYEAVVFDLDGTLVEYTGRDRRRAAAVETFDALGVDPTADELRSVAAGSTANARAVCRAHGADPAEFYERFDPLLADLQLDAIDDGGKRPYDDAVAALDRLRVGDGGPPAAVLSNNFQSVVDRVVERHFPGRFAVVTGVSPGPEGRERRKPDPRQLVSTLATLGSAPEGALVVGDGSSDVAVAARAGVDSVHVERAGPHEGADDPTYRVETLQALPALVRRSA
jgi:phosphoglycolate phosphatase